MMIGQVFIKIFKKPEHSIPMGTEFGGEYESMVQRVYRQIKIYLTVKSS